MDLININHLLQLVLSDISSNNFKPVFLAECQLLELLESKPNLDDVSLN